MDLLFFSQRLEMRPLFFYLYIVAIIYNIGKPEQIKIFGKLAIYNPTFLDNIRSEKLYYTSVETPIHTYQHVNLYIIEILRGENFRI